MNENPLTTVWDALARADCNPHGEPHDFRSRCPVHESGTEALHVFEGIDRRVRVHCFARDCGLRDIADALNLDPRSFYPAGDRRSGRRSVPRARRGDFSGNAALVAGVLVGLQRRDGWSVEIKLDECPVCNTPNPNLVIPHAGRPFLHCEHDCDAGVVIADVARAT